MAPKSSKWDDKMNAALPPRPRWFTIYFNAMPQVVPELGMARSASTHWSGCLARVREVRGGNLFQSADHADVTAELNISSDTVSEVYWQKPPFLPPWKGDFRKRRVFKKCDGQRPHCDTLVKNKTTDLWWTPRQEPSSISNAATPATINVVTATGNEDDSVAGSAASSVAASDEGPVTDDDAGSVAGSDTASDVTVVGIEYGAVEEAAIVDHLSSED
ncbi:Uu.00g111780.m01.CDS01 [Anthostomella pinea]|uniref:Uu.00g111780.m01.CDS01 n=1 Tax=Anthostomella pinea TaxID=933095 RepID=A0AAI8VF64_9PEZI|nr:Uu.00g111780.m01.CDS01 [Anthostomella pinea]